MYAIGYFLIEYLDKPFSDEQSLTALNLYVRNWFLDKFKELTPPQKFAFKLINDKFNVLITAPTGSGKTMSGFLSIISKLFDYALEGKLENRVYCIYVSPLRSLNNDIYKNLSVPLDEIYAQIIKNKGMDIIKNNIKKVSVGVRTGDTTQKERRLQLIRPPNILVTTPESLAIMINSKRFIENIGGIEYLIIDEIHELASNKRGVHLSLSIERLMAIVKKNVVRIGLGATIYPLEEAAKFLVGYSAGNTLRECKVIDASWSKKLEVIALSPVNDLVHTPNKDIDNAIYKKIDSIIKNNRSTLIFTNTRSGTERVVFNLKSRYGYGNDIAAHHGSLSKDTRLEVEEKLKKGELSCVVTSTSLELGVDIGSIENVIQLGSSKSISRAVQRIGRAGHSFKSIAIGEVIALDRDDLIECSVMVDNVIKKRLDSFSTPKNALDVLAQHIIGMSLNKKWGVDEAYDLVRKAYPYNTLDKNEFIATINYLGGKYLGLEHHRVYGKIWYDEKEGTFNQRGRLSQVMYMLNLGTIPDDVAINVFTLDKKWVGSIEEEFMTKMKQHDIFALGGKLYEFLEAKETRCIVAAAKSLTPTIPPWFSEQLPLSFELAQYIGEFRKKLGDTLSLKQKNKSINKKADAILNLMPIDKNAKKIIYNYFIEQFLYTKIIPNNELILIEDTFEPNSTKNKKHLLIFHSMFGRRINDILSRIFAMELGEILDMNIDIILSDNGFILNIGELIVNSQMIDEIISNISSANISTMLKHNIRKTELMKRRFRHVAGRGFMVLRNYKGNKIGVRKQQLNSQMILKNIDQIDKNFPLLKETYREILYDLMDMPRAQQILYDIKEGKIKYKIIKTKFPSPFAHKMLIFGGLSNITLENTQQYLQN